MEILRHGRVDEIVRQHAHERPPGQLDVFLKRFIDQVDHLRLLPAPMVSVSRREKKTERFQVPTDKIAPVNSM